MEGSDLIGVHMQANQEVRVQVNDGKFHPFIAFRYACMGTLPAKAKALEGLQDLNPLPFFMPEQPHISYPYILDLHSAY